jgi:hypothetical protein
VPTRGVTIRNSRSVSSSETGCQKRDKKAGKHTYFYQLNDRKLLVVFNMARHEGLQLHHQI